ncbi:MAG: AAA family ATPase [Bacilli bacterium]
MIGNFNDEAQNVLMNAKKEMLDLGHPYIGTEHLLLSILNTDSNICERLNSYGLYYDNFKEELSKVIGTSKKKSEYILYTPLLRKVIQSAIIDSKENNDGEVTVEHLFFSMLEEGEGIAIRILIGMNIDIESMYDDFSTSLIKKNKRNKKKKLLVDDLGIDLTNEAMNGKLDPVIGREKEVKRVMEILCRRTKNNPILIGEAGVGKTAIVEELSRLIANENVPSGLLNKRIISIDMATMVAGTKYRGEFEERMKKLLKEIEDNTEIILFIDEIHTLVGAGGAEGAIDASNILKPSLARGKIRCIGATTTEEYKKFIEKDSALERRFQKVFVEEPSIEETKNILFSIRDIYEKYHNVVISDNVLNNLINISEKYIFDRNRPDKEIDILDEVCARASIKEIGSDRLSNIKKEINRLCKEKNSFIIDNNVDKAFDIRKKEVKLMSELNELELSCSNRKNEVLIEDIASVVSNRAKVPISDILSSNIDNIYDIEKKLKSIIIGHDKVIDSLINITKRIKYGDNRCYSMMFVGPSGVGKTYLSKEYAKLLVGESNFIRLDMSEYSDSTAVNKILGSAPGYVGYDDNKNILEEIRNNPNSVILLDEIDKAHSSVINLFYQILEEGKIKNSKGTTVRFNNAIIIMTSNAGFENNCIGFNKSEDNITSLKNRFSTSFINRIDGIMMFNRLNEDDIKKIINLKLDNINKKYSSININYSDDLIMDIINKSDYYNFGARRLDKIISRGIENNIIEAIINNDKEIFIDKLNEYEKNITKA